MSKLCNVTNPSLVVRNVTKVYKRKRIFSGFSRSQFIPKTVALKNVSLQASPGDSIGVLGENGSGKSTFLRLIAGAENPTSGEILAKSQPTLLGINAALVPNVSGSQNIDLALLAAGLTPDFIEENKRQIVDFAGIGEAIHRPMKEYSSGMDARLRFAIATAIPRDILLIDEALSVGDAAFQEKSKTRMHELLDNSGTIFLVSHSAGLVETTCKRAIWIHKGELIADGAASEVAVNYRNWVLAKQDNDDKLADSIIGSTRNGFVPRKLILSSQIEMENADQ